jgi:hypothetical protein
MRTHCLIKSCFGRVSGERGTRSRADEDE